MRSSNTPLVGTVLRHKRQFSKGLALVVLSLVMVVFGAGGAQVSARTCAANLSQNDCDALGGGWVGWVPEGNCSVGSTDDPLAPTTGDAGNAGLYTTYPHIKEAFQFFIQHGYTPAQASGIVGNLMVESGQSINPKATGDYLKGVDSAQGVPTSFGIAQWHNDRGTAMFAWVTAWSASNNDPDGKYSFNGQLNYLLYDLQHNHASIDAAIKQMDSPEAVAAYWDVHFEVSDGKARNQRTAYARGVFDAAGANGWAVGINVIPDGAAPDSSTSGICNNAVAGTVAGTTCADIGKKSDSTRNPFVCTNPEVKCATGTDAGVGEGYVNGHEYDIRLCRVQGVTVNAFISGSIDAMINAARAGGLRLTGGGFRTMQGQIDTRVANHCHPDDLLGAKDAQGRYSYTNLKRNHDAYPATACKTQTAPPGYSNHQMGLAVDWSACNTPKCSTSLIRSHSTAGWQWLNAHAASFGFKNLPVEPWHWSVDGG